MTAREIPGRNFPRYWLAMSDAAAFTLVQTVLAFCAELRRDIAVQSGAAPKLHAAEIAELLLSAADGGWGKAKAATLVKEIVDLSAMDDLRAGKVHLLIHGALARLPAAAWPPEKMAARRELSDELRQLARRLGGKEAGRRSKDEESVQRLYDSAQRLRK